MGAVVKRMRTALSREERYARELDHLLARVGRLEAQAVRRTLSLLEAARARMIARLAEVPEESFLASFLPQLQGEIERTMRSYARQYQVLLDDETQNLVPLAAETVTAPLEAAGLALVLPGLDPAFLDVLQGFRANLITNVANDAITRITSELQLGVLGGLTPFQVQRRIGEILRTQPNAQGVFGTVANRAEAISRTEFNRVFNLSVHARQQQMTTAATEVYPGWQPRKRWLNAGDHRVRPSHKRADLLAQRPLMEGGEFTLIDSSGQQWKATGPYDARLPVSQISRCRCRSMLATDDDGFQALLADVT